MATPKSQHIPGQHCIKAWVRPTCSRQLKSHDTCFLCPSVIHSSLASFHAGSIQAALIGSFRHCFKFEKIKTKKQPLSSRETNGTKYGGTYGLGPLSRLSPLTVRCVFYVMLWTFSYGAVKPRQGSNRRLRAAQRCSVSGFLSSVWF